MPCPNPLERLPLNLSVPLREPDLVLVLLTCRSVSFVLLALSPCKLEDMILFRCGTEFVSSARSSSSLAFSVSSSMSSQLDRVSGVSASSRTAVDKSRFLGLLWKDQRTSILGAGEARRGDNSEDDGLSAKTTMLSVLE